MSKALIVSLIAGLLSAGLFLIIFGIGLGFIFMFLPTLPLLSLGLSRDASLTIISSATASVIIAAVAGLPVGILFMLFLGFPCWYMVDRALRSHNGQWFPVGIIFLHLTIAACVAVAVVALYYHDVPGGLPAMVSKDIHEAFSDVDGEYAEVIDTLASQWSFLVFSITTWLWALALYAHGWLATRALNQKRQQLRPDFAIHPFPMPNWMFSLMAIAALASLIGSESMSFVGKSTLISLMLPYFLLGAQVMHSASQTWPSRRFFLFFIYFSIFAQFWPAMILSGVGLYTHIKSINKHLSGDGSSSKS